MQHVDEGRLHAWLDGELPEWGSEGARALERHLEGCAACRDRVDEARRMIREASAILGGADPGEIATPRTIPLAAAPLPRPILRRPWVAVGWAASVLVALGVGWMARPAPPERVVTLPAEQAARAGDAGPLAVEPAPVQAEATSRARNVEPVVRASPPAASAVEQVAIAPPPPSAPPPPPAVERAPVAMSAPSLPAAEIPPPAPAPAVADVLASRAAGVAVTNTAGLAVTVRGQVTDEEGRALPGAVVRAPTLATSTTTRADGSYTLTLPAERVAPSGTVAVTATRIGMATQTRTVSPASASAPLNFELRADVLALEAVVATGEATRARRAAPVDDMVWRGVPREEAERRLGSRLVTVPRLPLLGIEVRELEGSPSIRVRQRLENGDVLSMIQQRAPRSTSAARNPIVRDETAGGSRIRLRRNGLVVDASAPISSDSLNILLEPLF
ncbi:MAG TPA: carboxypeptidase regulatory-like domain-containing protein [Longimicrobium sp.]|nr:carboxypeptidase regulatory-like domain-containing protein [Longimicrobium sp.]